MRTDATPMNGHRIPVERARRDSDGGDGWKWVRKAATLGGLAALIVGGAIYVAPESKLEKDEAVINAQESHLAVHDKYLEDFDSTMKSMKATLDTDHDLIEQQSARQGIYPRREACIP